MTAGVRPAHWVISLGLHLFVLVLLVFLWPHPATLPPIAIHLSAPLQNSGASEPSANLPAAPRVPQPQILKPVPVPQPEWKPLSVNKSFSEPQPPAQTPQTAEDLLGTGFQEPATQPQQPRLSSLRWTSHGSQAPDQLPPQPPREWVASGEVRWQLRLTIPAEGGSPVKIEGLDSAHPELDSWLANWLERQVFPASDQHKEYQIQWVLTLRAVLPR
ncbi:MAG: hypothetical protein HKM06_09280 [Spirochaetales bacterium]|nr:hypothetical protein [Spirochaetales bacterium]